jgi:hypothetical protein
LLLSPLFLADSAPSYTDGKNMVGRQTTVVSSANCFGQALNLIYGITEYSSKVTNKEKEQEKEKLELTPSEYVEKKVNASKLIDNVSFPYYLL